MRKTFCKATKRLVVVGRQPKPNNAREYEMGLHSSQLIPCFDLKKHILILLIIDVYLNSFACLCISLYVEHAYAF